MKPFICPICNNGYSYKTGLNYHVRTSHEGAPKRRRPLKPKNEALQQPVKKYYLVPIDELPLLFGETRSREFLEIPLTPPGDIWSDV